MLKNYFVVTLRTILRNRIFSMITIGGLALAITASFLLYQYVMFETGYDRTSTGQLYRVPVRYFRGESPTGGNAANASAAGPEMKNEFPEIVSYARLVKTSNFTSSLTKAVVNSIEFSRSVNRRLVAFNEENVYMADAPLIDMFSFRMSSGSSATALEEPNTIVLTESTAKKYFGDEQPIGKTLTLNRELELTVTGVMKDLPANSHLRFDMLISYKTLDRTFDGDTSWGWTAFYTYVTLAPQTNPAMLEAKLVPFLKKHAPDFADNGEYHSRFFLQPVSDIHLRSRLDAEQSPVSDEKTIYFLSVLAVVILVIAWINYVNLSTAKALERSKEVGLRKVVGASKIQLVGQFMIDAVVVNVLAMFFAAVLVTVAWSSFENLVGKQIAIDVFTSPQSGIIVALALIAGVFVVGSYPALMLSAFNPAMVLKGKFLKSSSGAVARKSMISFQYIIAFVLLGGTLLLYRQLSFMQSQDPGYNRDSILVLEGPAVYDSTTNQKVLALKNKLMELPGVQNMTASANIPGQRIVERSGFQKMGSSGDNGWGSSILGTDTSFMSAYGIRLVEGRMFNDGETMNFRRHKAPEMIRIVVNEEFVRRMSTTPKLAINEKVSFWWGPDERLAEIVGVVADHHQLSLQNPLQPIAYMQPQWTTWKYFSVKLSAKNSNQTKIAIRDTFSKIFPDNPYVAFQLDDYYSKQYENDQKMGQLVGIFTGLAIVVTCLGLVGLTVFSVSQRTKEIGIRKVLGSPVVRILFLLSGDLIKILLIAYVISVPLILIGGSRWLEQFAFKTGISWSVLALPLLLLLMITLFVVIGISFRKAMDNPVKALKYE